MGQRSWRNGQHGYGLITKVLHWSMAIAITAQFIVGYAVDVSGRGRGRGRGRGGSSGRGRGRGGDSGYDPFGDDAVLTVHVVLGLTVLALAVTRLVWRLTTPLPPWAEGLSSTERALSHWVERALYLSMFTMPITGIALVLTDDRNLVWIHVASHVVFFVAIALHVGLIIKHQLVKRDGLVRRMW